jgi:hypothetical protein
VTPYQCAVHWWPTPRFVGFPHHFPLTLQYSSFNATIWFEGTAADAAATATDRRADTGQGVQSFARFQVSRQRGSNNPARCGAWLGNRDGDVHFIDTRTAGSMAAPRGRSSYTQTARPQTCRQTASRSPYRGCGGRRCERRSALWLRRPSGSCPSARWCSRPAPAATTRRHTL